jgi:mono/diheme cytochrome c family protein
VTRRSPQSARSSPPLRRIVLLGVLAVVAAGCGAVGRVTSGDPATGKTLFIAKCGSCHTLASAGTKGSFIAPGKPNPAGGPDLDDAFRADKSRIFASSGTEQTIRDVVRGQIAYAEKPMPTNLVRGKQADDVSVFVAKCAAEPKCSVSASG